MHLNAINTLNDLRDALAAAPEQRLELFRERVMAPLHSFWAPFLSWMNAPVPDQGDPALHAARVFGYYSPEQDPAAGLAALERLTQAGTWDDCVAALQRAIDALNPQQHGLPLDKIDFTLVLGNPATLNEQAGSYTGFGSVPGTVLVMVWPNDFNLPRLPAATAHECNHNVRFLVEPFNPSCTLGQYMVAEGLAEAFAAELYGEERIGPWATDLSAEQIAALKPRFQAALELNDFNVVRGYIFGDWAAERSGYTAQGLPDFAGYAMGYRLVLAYLERSGQSAAQATYRPWQEIVSESGFF